MRQLLLLAAAFAAACSQPTPDDAELARQGTEERAEALPDSVADLVQARVPRAAAGDSGWMYAQEVRADLDGDDQDEVAVLISDVTLDAGGAPLWEDGHRWQLYVREADGRTTRLYARFVPNGKVTAELAVPPSGRTMSIVLLEQSPAHVGVYEFRYRGPDRVDVYSRLDRDLDATRRFSGSPRP